VTELTISGQFLIAIGWQVPMTASSLRDRVGPGNR
jgi:hypothetical protein